MSREFQLASTLPVQDHYFRFLGVFYGGIWEGLGQNKSINIILNNDIYVSQIVLQCQYSSKFDVSITLPSGTQYTIKSYSTAATDFYFNDGNDYIFWSQLPRSSRIVVTKTDSSPNASSGILEVAITTRVIMEKPPDFFTREGLPSELRRFPPL